MNHEKGAREAIGHREFAISAAAEAAEMRIQVQRLESENQKLRRRLDRVYGSWTWRAGRLVLFPYHLLNRLKSQKSETR